MTTTTEQLQFGYNPGLEGATCAWGARWIIHQDGDVDQLYDRQDMIGTREQKDELAEWLNNTVKRKPHDALSVLLSTHQISTRESKEVVLYEDERGVVLGNPNASAGYFYVVARFWKIAANG